MKTLIFIMIIFLSFIQYVSGQWITIYEDDFSSDPNYTVINEHPISGDLFEWNSSGGYYWAQSRDEYNRYEKRAISPTFTRVENQSFRIELDILHSGCGYGHGLPFSLINSATGDYSTFFTCGVDHNVNSRYNNFSISVQGFGDDNSLYNKTVTLDVWYHWIFEYDNSSNIFTYSVTRDGTTFHSNNFTIDPPLPFDRVSLGWKTWYGESSTPAEMAVDNIVITAYNSNPITWQLHLTASVASTRDTLNYAGVAAAATDGFDSYFDMLEFAQPPSNFVQLYFPHPEWSHPLGNNFTRDIRAEADLSDAKTVWEFEVDTDHSGSTVTLVISPQAVPTGFGLILRDLFDGATQNLRSDDTYTYTAASSRNFKMMVGDSTAPSVAVTAPNGGEVISGTYDITWTASDGSGLESFALEYSTDNGNSYTPITTVAGDQTGYLWTVPNVLSYQALVKIIATDSMGNVAEDVSNACFTITAHEQSHTFNAGWNLMSVPLIPDDPLAAAVIGDDVSSYYYLGSYNTATGYFTSDSVINGKGYWLGCVDPIDLDVQGNTVVGPKIIPLTAGWNIIGNPLIVPIAKTQIDVQRGETIVDFNTAVSSGWISNVLYTFSAGDPGYRTEDNLQTWSGYWLGTLLDGVSLIFRPPTLAKSRSLIQPRIAATDDWEINIIAHSDDYADSISAFGVNQAATNGFDPVYDAPEPPMQPDGNGIRLYFPHPEWGVILGDKFNRDIQAPLTVNESRSWTFDVQRIGSVSLSWDVSAVVKPYLFTLTDLDAGISTDMSTSSEYTYTGEDEIRHFMLVTVPSGVEDRQNSQPLGYDLAQNYPNPFNPQTGIRFQLPKAGKVSILIYNHLGQKLRTLIDSHKLSGEHLVTWNGRDDAGQLVPSGIYFYKLQVGSNVLASRKMILLK